MVCRHAAMHMQVALATRCHQIRAIIASHGGRRSAQAASVDGNT